jgi:hypothetical protein
VAFLKEEIKIYSSKDKLSQPATFAKEAVSKVFSGKSKSPLNSFQKAVNHPKPTLSPSRLKLSQLKLN